MAFWDIFNRPEVKLENSSRLQRKIENLLPNANEQDLVTIACVAGLLARIAYIDFSVAPQEIETIRQILKEWSHFDDLQINAITQIAIEEIKDLSGLENHKYCHPLNDILTNDQKYQIIEALFALAASDGAVDYNEAEEIRIITNGLRLEHKHFIAARATVLEKLSALASLSSR